MHIAVEVTERDKELAIENEGGSIQRNSSLNCPIYYATERALKEALSDFGAVRVGPKTLLVLNSRGKVIYNDPYPQDVAAKIAHYDKTLELTVPFSFTIDLNIPIVA